jgi:hypothetical protein
MFTKIKNFILWPWTRYQRKKQFKKRLEELKQKDPFIYE